MAEIPAFDFGPHDSIDDSASVEFEGFTITARIEQDHTATPPWEAHDGHGPVSEWRRRDSKRAGELVLSADGNSCRFYNFAEACRTARAEGWGWVPGELTTVEESPGQWVATAGGFTGKGEDINAATRAVYAAHRATMTARQYAAGAALRDFQRLKAWCDDEWTWAGVCVVVSRAGVQLTSDYAHALWGIESDAGAYFAEVAGELAAEALATARAKLAELVTS